MWFSVPLRQRNWRPLRELLPLMEWWTYSAKSLALVDFAEATKVESLFVTGSCCQLLVAKMSLTMWANLLPKHQDAALGKLNNDMSLYGDSVLWPPSGKLTSRHRLTGRCIVPDP